MEDDGGGSSKRLPNTCCGFTWLLTKYLGTAFKYTLRITSRASFTIAFVFMFTEMFILGLNYALGAYYAMINESRSSNSTGLYIYSLIIFSMFNLVFALITASRSWELVELAWFTEPFRGVHSWIMHSSVVLMYVIGLILNRAQYNDTQYEEYLGFFTVAALYGTALGTIYICGYSIFAWQSMHIHGVWKQMFKPEYNNPSFVAILFLIILGIIAVVGLAIYANIGTVFFFIVIMIYTTTLLLAMLHDAVRLDLSSFYMRVGGAWREADLWIHVRIMKKCPKCDKKPGAMTVQEENGKYDEQFDVVQVELFGSQREHVITDGGGGASGGHGGRRDGGSDDDDDDDAGGRRTEEEEGAVMTSEAAAAPAAGRKTTDDFDDQAVYHWSANYPYHKKEVYAANVNTSYKVWLDHPERRRLYCVKNDVGRVRACGNPVVCVMLFVLNLMLLMVIFGASVDVFKFGGSHPVDLETGITTSSANDNRRLQSANESLTYYDPFPTADNYAYGGLAVCGLNYNGLRVSDMAVLAAAAYTEVPESTDNCTAVQQSLDLWFQDIRGIEMVAEYCHAPDFNNDPPQYASVYSASLGVRYIIVRGSVSGVDWLTDADFYKEIMWVQAQSFLTNLLQLLPKPFLAKFIKVFSISDSVQKHHNEDSYFQAMEEYILEMKAAHPNTPLYLVGHSLGGAMVNMIAARNSIRSVAFEPPGGVYQTARFGYTLDSYRTWTSSIVADHDIIPIIDRQSGNVQRIACVPPERSAAPDYCHAIDRVFCQLLAGCNADFTPFPQVPEYCQNKWEITV